MRYVRRFKSWCEHDLDRCQSPLYHGLRTEDRPVVWRFIEENYLERYRLILTVSFEWCSMGLWRRKFPGAVDMGWDVDPDKCRLPEEIREALAEWHDYGDHYAKPWEPDCPFDHEMWSRWGLQVAKRIALVLPKDIYLEFNPFRQLVAGPSGTVVELDVPAFIKEICAR